MKEAYVRACAVSVSISTKAFMLHFKSHVSMGQPWIFYRFTFHEGRMSQFLCTRKLSFRNAKKKLNNQKRNTKFINSTILKGGKFPSFHVQSILYTKIIFLKFYLQKAHFRTLFEWCWCVKGTLLFKAFCFAFSRLTAFCTSAWKSPFGCCSDDRIKGLNCIKAYCAAISAAVVTPSDGIICANDAVAPFLDLGISLKYTSGMMRGALWFSRF